MGHMQTFLNILLSTGAVGIENYWPSILSVPPVIEVVVRVLAGD